MEALAYYFGMKPEEYWNARYREVTLYCNVNLFKITDNIKRNIELYEAVTDKIITANAMCVKKPKFLKLKEMFGNLFKKKEQTVEEQIKMLRRMK
ncbi:MAG: hypothetical protein ACI4ON_00440 [Clostridia bacterium]